MRNTKRLIDFMGSLTDQLDELADENERTGKHEKRNFSKTVREVVRLGFERKAQLEFKSK